MNDILRVGRINSAMFVSPQCYICSGYDEPCPCLVGPLQTYMESALRLCFPVSHSYQVSQVGVLFEGGWKGRALDLTCPCCQSAFNDRKSSKNSVIVYCCIDTFSKGFLK